MQRFLVFTSVTVVLAIIVLGGVFVWRELSRQTMHEPQAVLPLPGELSKEQLFNSNNPEEVHTEGILLSTFSPAGKVVPEAHLDYAFSGKFGIFSHHIVKSVDGKENRRTLYEAFLLHNPGKETAHVTVTNGSICLMEPDAPYFDDPPMAPNPFGALHSGPGSRAADEVVRGRHPPENLVKKEVTVPPGSTVILAKLPIPVRDLNPPFNKLSTLLYLAADKGCVQVADVVAFADFDEKTKSDIVPSDEKFLSLVTRSSRAGPAEPAATAPGQKGAFRYGRVAGVSLGTHWRNSPANSDAIEIKGPGEQFSYVVSSLKFGTHGTGQDQSAPMTVRYPDSAFRAQGNYGLFYDVVFNLKNSTDQARKVDVLFQTPLKSDKPDECLTFTDPPYDLMFYRGTIKLTYTDEHGKQRCEYFHFNQRRGERGTRLVTVPIKPGQTSCVRLELVYAADSTPPQVITFRTSTSP